MEGRSDKRIVPMRTSLRLVTAVVMCKNISFPRKYNLQYLEIKVLLKGSERISTYREGMVMAGRNKEGEDDKGIKC